MLYMLYMTKSMTKTFNVDISFQNSKFAKQNNEEILHRLSFRILH